MRGWILLLLVGSCTGPKKNEFIEKFEPQMVEWFCKSTNRAESCFVIDAGQCSSLAKRVVSSCSAQFKDQMPETFDRTSGEKFGRLIGECAGIAFNAELVQQHKPVDPYPAKCDDPTAWE